MANASPPSVLAGQEGICRRSHAWRIADNLVKQQAVCAVWCMVGKLQEKIAYKQVADAVADSRFRGDCQWSTIRTGLTTPHQTSVWR